MENVLRTGSEGREFQGRHNPGGVKTQSDTVSRHAPPKMIVTSQIPQNIFVGGKKISLVLNL